MSNYIQNRNGDLWSHRSKRWIESREWLTWSQNAIDTECGYDTYRGCNQVAAALWRKGFDTYQWGAIKLDPTKQGVVA